MPQTPRRLDQQSPVHLFFAYGAMGVMGVYNNWTSGLRGRIMAASAPPRRMEPTEVRQKLVLVVIVVMVMMVVVK